MTLSPKESSLLKDLQGQEQLCVEKYSKHASCAHDPQLKSLLNLIGSVEQTHLNSINQMMGGTVPQMSGGQSQTPAQPTAYYTQTNDANKQSDAYLCKDILTTEKHASALYDTCIFEFKDTCARDFLNHVQKEEQEHGKYVYDYMSVNSMYS